MIVAASTAAAGLIAGCAVTAGVHAPLRWRVSALVSVNEALERQCKRGVCDLTLAKAQLQDKADESARYASALARITMRLPEAAPKLSEPFYPHRKAVFERAVLVVSEACREDAV